MDEFFVNISNEPPSIPSINWPPDLSKVTDLQSDLKIKNAIDIDLDIITYDFELYSAYSAGTLTGLVTSTNSEKCS